MPYTFFVVILRYVADINEIDQHRSAHLEYLDSLYAKGVFVASGRQIPLTGGIILAKSNSRQELCDLLTQDPFAIHKLAEYQVFEFQPNKYSKEFEAVLKA